MNWKNDMDDCHPVQDPGMIIPFKKRFDTSSIGTGTGTFHGSREKVTKKSMANLIIKQQSCSDCGSSEIIDDKSRGEKICRKCGIVINEHSITFHIPRAFTQQDIKRKVHYEPLTPGNRAVIIFNSSDPDLKRRQRENNRIEWKDRRVMIASFEIAKLKHYLPITQRVEKMAMHEVRKIFKTGILQGRSVIAMGTALLYWACIQCNSPITFQEITERSPEKKKAIRNAINLLSCNFNYKFLPKQNYAAYFTRANNNLGLPQKVCTKAIRIFELYKKNEGMLGNPKGWIGGALYHAYKTTRINDDGDANESIGNFPVGKLLSKMQSRIATAIGINELTIRKRAGSFSEFVTATGIEI
jgi:transcription initiation factor TFIIB